MIDHLILLAVLIVLVFVAGLYGRLSAVPASVRRLVQDEIERARAADASEAEKALQEAVAKQASMLLTGLRLYHEELGAIARREAAAAEVRARVAERGGEHMAAALEAATALVRDLRSIVNANPGHPSPDAASEALPEPEARATVEMPGPRANAMDDEPDEEKTKVTKNPITGSRAAANGLRLATTTPVSSRGKAH